MKPNTCPKTMATCLRAACATRLLPLLLLLTLPAVVQAEDYTYTTNNGTITITGYTGPGGAVTIPGTINGLPVTSIGDWAFAYCTSLTSVTIPDSVASIGDNAFAGCTSLTEITVHALNPVYSSVDGVLFNKSQTTLIQCPGGKAGDYTLPDSVTSIGDSAFAYNSSLTSVTIPDSVTSIGDWAFAYCTSLTSVTIGNSVTSIREGAFYQCTSLTSVTIGNSVTSIREGAFYQCTSLTSVTIGNSVTSIGDQAFFECTSLTSVRIGDSVTSIGRDAFMYCTSLTSVTIPDSVTSIGFMAFYQCTSLTEITVDALNPVYSSVDGVLFSKSQTTLIQCPGGKAGDYTLPGSVTSIGDLAFAACTSLTSVTIGTNVTSIGGAVFYNCASLTSVTIPDSVTSIGDSAFAYNSSLTKVTIPDSVTSIGRDAFAYCTSLTKVTIPDSVTSIGGDAFACCTSLTSVTIGNGVTTIGDWAFAYCTSLTSVTIPDSVASIGDLAFAACTSLTSVTIGTNVTSIGGAVFYNCASLTSVTIPDSVASIGDNAFAGCTSLTEITVHALNPVYSSVDGVLFNKSQTTLIQCPGGKAGDYTLPDSITSIGDDAFAGCTSLTSVTIPDSVTSIGDGAFYGCSSLTGVYFLGNAPLASSPFSRKGSSSDAIVYYLPWTTGWGATYGGRPTALWNLPPLAGAGYVVAWGANWLGQTDVPANATNVVAVAGGYDHSLGLRADGTVIAWGDNDYGQSTLPEGLSNVVAIAAGGSHNLALKSDRTVVAWGYNMYGQCTVPDGLSNVVAVAAGRNHSVALKSDTMVVAWGESYARQCTVPDGLSNVVAIAAGGSHNLALKSDRTVVAWGANWLGQSTVPERLTNVVAVAAGASHSLALQADGTVVAWGGGSPMPEGLSNVVAIAAGGEHSLALKSDTTVVAWGDNDYGQCTVPGGLSNVVAIAAGSGHSLALGSGAPVITVQPLSQAAQEGSDVTLTAKAGGAEPLSYQWQFDGINIAGATISSLTLTNVQAAQAGSYSVVVSNTYGSVSSSNALLTLYTVIITSQPERYRAVLVGWTNTFTVVADGSPPLNYQWSRDGTDIPGATMASLTLTNIQLADAGTYGVVVSNSFGWTNSQPAILAVVFPNSNPIKYVAASNATPVAPFATWGTAAINIQDAVLFANDRDIILVTNGVYAGGSRVVDGTTNRVAVDRAVLLKSVNGPEVTVITGQRDIRCVYLTDGAVLSGFTLTDGSCDEGGGIYNGANATVTNCIIQRNLADSYRAHTGGGIHNSGNMALNRCVIEDNWVYEGWGGAGGLFNSGIMILVNCTISGNRPGPSGGVGGILNAGAMILGGCVISNNVALGDGAGICNGYWGQTNGTIVLTNCTIVKNRGGSEYWGGGIANYGDASLRDCSVVGNRSGWGGGILNWGGVLAVTNCTIATNEAFTKYGPAGGGLYNGGTAILENTTVSGNTNNAGGAGAGIYNYGGTLTLISSTVCSNQFFSFGGAPHGDGGGVYNRSGAVNSKNSIVAGNDSANAPDFYGTLTSQGFNLIQNTDGCTIEGDQAGNIYGADPILGPLQDNGGPTWTHALLPESVAIDAGPANTPPGVDQRGVPRPQGLAEDIGASEYQGDVPIIPAVERLMAQVELRWPRSQPLIATLSAALHSIERGNFVSAINQLQAFQKKVRTQVAKSDPALAANFIQVSQGIIDALRGDAADPGSRPHGRFTSVARHSDGRVQMQWSAPPGPLYLLEASTNLVDWERIGVAVDQGNGSFTCEDPNAARFPNRFYRVVSP